MTNPLYFVEVDFERFGKAFVETDRDKNSKKAVIAGIADCQYGPVLTVLEIFEDEGTCRDVTEDIARDVFDLLDKRQGGAPDELRDWLDQWVGAGACDVLNATAGRFGDVYRNERRLEAAE